ncbi:hypothetical protein LAY91_24250, partial [Escherichia coli]|nr:hypothetical protein [Escherichia coli]
QPEASSPGAKDENTGAGLCRSRLVVQERLGHYNSLQVFIALLRKITIRKESGQDSLFHTSTNPQQVKAVCSNCS